MIGVISNPNSRKNKKNKKLSYELKKIVGEHGIFRESKSLSDIKVIAKEFKEKKIDILAINGGDGTLHINLSTFVKVYDGEKLPKILILRGGTMNTISNSIKSLRGTPQNILSNIVNKKNQNHIFNISQRNILNINGEYGFIFGNGVIYNFLDLFYKNEDPSPLSAGIMLLKSSLNAFLNKKESTFFKKEEFELEIDGIKWLNNSFLSVGAMSIREIGLGFMPGARIINHPQKFSVFAIKSGAWGVVKVFPKIWLGYGFGKKVAEEKLVEELILKAKKDPVVYTIDGEMYPAAKEVKITLGPKVDFILD